MDSTGTSSDPTTGNRRALRAVCIVACLLGWSASGAATPSALQDEPSHLQGLELATGDYAAEIADLAGVPEASADVQVPYLFLTPRVATILENVFGDALAAAGAAEAAAPEEEKDQAPASAPVAENLEHPLSPEPPSLDTSAILPRFQRQMYRTDI